MQITTLHDHKGQLLCALLYVFVGYRWGELEQSKFAFLNYRVYQVSLDVLKSKPLIDNWKSTMIDAYSTRLFVESLCRCYYMSLTVVSVMRMKSALQQSFQSHYLNRCSFVFKTRPQLRLNKLLHRLMKESEFASDWDNQRVAVFEGIDANHLIEVSAQDTKQEIGSLRLSLPAR